MNKSSSVRRIFAGLFVVLFALSGSAFARPLPERSALFDDTIKLPPVNWIRSRKIDVRHVDIDLKFDWGKEQAIGSTVVTFAPFGDADTVTLDAAMMVIDSVTMVGGGPLKFNYDAKADNDNLSIMLGRTVKDGEEVKVKIEYKTNYVNVAEPSTPIGTFGRGLRFIKPTADDPNKPRQIWSQGETDYNRYWFPSYDSPNDFRTQDLTATVAKPFYVVSNGKLVETKENSDGTRTFHWKMDQPFSNYLSSIVVAETAPVEQKFEDVPVYNYGYVNETKEVAATTKNLPATIAFFSQVTGVKYPYPKYSQAFVEDFGGGMENISATTQIEEMIHDDRELLDQDSESLQSHELAHQWFGDYVTCRDWSQVWLNESFATYMQAMWTEKFKGHDEFLYSDIRANHDKVLGSWANGNRRPVVTKYFVDKDAIFDNYAYPGGGSVLHMLRKHLGDALFFKSLNHYLTVNAHKPVATEDFRRAIEETTGQSMDWFFDEWLYRMGHPIFEITQSYDDAAKKLTLNVKQTQKVDVNNEYPQIAFFQSKVDVEIDGKVQTVWLEPKEMNTFTFDSATRPKIVNFDYESSLLKEMKFDKSTDDLIYQMLNDKDILARRWAMGELEAKATGPDKDRVVTALLAAAEKDTNFRIRRAAVTVVASIFSPDPPAGQEAPATLPADVEASMTRLTKDANSLVRAEAIQLLGETRDPKKASIYLPFLNDQSYGVIDAASEALARTGDAKVYDSLAKLTTMHSWKGRIEIAGLNGLAGLGDKRGFEIGYKMATDKSLSLAVRDSAVEVVGATGKGDPRAYPIIFEQFKGAVASDNFQPIFLGVQAIIKLADPRGQEAFDLLKEHYKGQNGPLQTIAQWETQFKEALKH